MSKHTIEKFTELVITSNIWFFDVGVTNSSLLAFQDNYKSRKKLAKYCIIQLVKIFLNWTSIIKKKSIIINSKYELGIYVGTTDS